LIRFSLAENIKTPQEALEHVNIRANDLAQIRPGKFKKKLNSIFKNSFLKFILNDFNHF
jgi:hypothetical protein